MRHPPSPAPALPPPHCQHRPERPDHVIDAGCVAAILAVIQHVHIQGHAGSVIAEAGPDEGVEPVGAFERTPAAQLAPERVNEPHVAAFGTGVDFNLPSRSHPLLMTPRTRVPLGGEPVAIRASVVAAIGQKTAHETSPVSRACPASASARASIALSARITSLMRAVLLRSLL